MPTALPPIIVGAGLSGLLLARALHQHERPAILLEKSRGLGGRMATKRLEGVSFDQGAQFFTCRTPEFTTVVEEWIQKGWTAPWPNSAQRRYVGRPAMTAVPKGLAQGLDIRQEHKVVALRRGTTPRWEVILENRPPLATDHLLLTLPPPQALALFAAGEVELPPPLLATLQRLTYHPCLAVLALLAGPSKIPVEGITPTQGPLRWLADNVKKGVASGTPAAVTLHATPEYSQLNYTAAEEVIIHDLLTAAAPLQGAPVTASALHRWKFSEPKECHGERSVWLPDLQLGFAGDAFGGPKIEGAALSGLDLAQRMYSS